MEVMMKKNNTRSMDNTCSFARFLEKRGICAQYTITGTPQQNGVSKRRNQTLLDIVISMLSTASLPILLWTYALKTAMYFQNRFLVRQIKRHLLNYGQEGNQV